LVLDSYIERTKLGVPIETTNSDTERLALFVISKAGFGVSMKWPKWRVTTEKSVLEDAEDDGEAEISMKRHKLSYDRTISILQKNIVPIVAIPHWFLKYAPSRKLNMTYLSFLEFGGYVKDLRDIARARMKENTVQSDLVSSMLRAAGGDGKEQLLSDEEFTGNTFVRMPMRRRSILTPDCFVAYFFH